MDGWIKLTQQRNTPKKITRSVCFVDVDGKRDSLLILSVLMHSQKLEDAKF